MSQDVFIYENMVQGMSEGVLLIDEKGKIQKINPAAKKILGLEHRKAAGGIAALFLDDERNLEFVQLILDAVYDRGMSHNAVVSFFDGENEKQLFVNTSFLQKEEQKLGVTVVLNDVTELMELRDAVQAMNRISRLNRKLELRNQFIQNLFGKYLSDDIVEQILKKGENQIGGTKREVTILFTDLRGFTTISESMQAEKLIQMLNHYLEEMIEIIQKWNGTILEFIGDAIVVVFGAPMQQEHTAADAVSCAVEMQNAMDRVNQYNGSKEFPELSMGIGIHHGTVVVGTIGSEKKMKYDMIGRNVNLASRIESCSVGGQILISDTVRREIAGRVKIGEEKETQLKGISKRVAIYEVLAMDQVKNAQSASWKNMEFFALPSPVEIEGRRIDGKRIESEKIPVKVTHRAGNYLRCIAEEQMELDQDYEFCYHNSEIYAKVIEKKKKEITLCITAGQLNL